jgi:hypothetical protein
LIVTGAVVLIRTAGVDVVDVQLPEYVPPAVIVMGPLKVGGGGGGAQAEVVAETDGREDTFPAASNASTPSVYVVAQLRPPTASEVEVVWADCDPFANTR